MLTSRVGERKREKRKKKREKRQNGGGSQVGEKKKKILLLSLSFFTNKWPCFLFLVVNKWADFWVLNL
jgi:hypothetical protein